MNREAGIKTRRAAMRAKERQKRKLILVGGLAVVLLVILILSIVLFVNDGKYDTGTNAVYVLENGKVVSVSVEAFDEKAYDKEELKAYIKETIDTYNSENGETLAKQKTLEIKDGAANLVMEYAGADVFEDFEGIELFEGSIADAKKAGYTFESEFASITDGKISACSAEDFMDNADYKVVIIKANTTVCIEDREICYVSTENVQHAAGSYVTIQEGASLVLTPEDTEEGEFVETTEGSDGAVGEDELEAGDDSSEIEFDFGDENTEEKSQYSDVYTYIIYK